MFRKFTIIAASTAILTFGGAFTTTASAETVETEQSYKVYYSVNGKTGVLAEEDAANLLKNALGRIQSKFLTNFDLSKIEKKLPVEQEAPAKETEQPEQQVEQPAEEKEQPVEKQEEQPKQEAPVQEAPEQPVAQPQQPTEPQVEERPTEPQEQEQQSALSEFEVQVVELTNVERAKQGLAALQIDEDLSNVAREKSKDMATNGYFDHNSPVYGSPFDMMQSFGINYRAAGENIAKGQRSPEEVVNAWMNSPGHRANIMNGNFTHIGVGFVAQGNHWTQMFIGK